MKISLAMIVRNNEDTIGECLESALPYVDELVMTDTGCTDDTMKVAESLAKKYNVKFVPDKYEDPKGHPKWISNFAEARNHGWKKCTGDVILWLDSDDVMFEWDESGKNPVRGMGKLRAYIQECFSDGRPEDKRIDSMMVRYDYGHDNYGYCNLRQLRLRVVRRDYFTWVEPVHENLMPLRPSKISEESYELPFWVRHNAFDSDRKSAERNLWIVNEWEKDHGELTARLLKGRAGAYRSMDKYLEAADDYSTALDICDMAPEEKYVCLLRRGDCYRLMHLTEDALDDYARAERWRPQYKEAYLASAEIFVDQEMWTQALAWCDKAEMAGDDENALVYNPIASVSVLARARAAAYEGLEDYDRALKQYEKLVKIYPRDTDLNERRLAIQDALAKRKVFYSFMDIHSECDDEGKQKLLEVAPDYLKLFPEFSHMIVPPQPKDKKYIAIMCGDTLNLWGPNSIKSGTGGSEESAIYIAWGFAKRGWHVEVYNSPHAHEIGVDEHGVWWLPYHAWDTKRSPDVFIGWRRTQSVGLGEMAGKKYLWLQDVPISQWYTKEFCDSIDGILCISKFQSGCLSEHGQEKSIWTANGLDPEMYQDGPNDPSHFIYASSPDRGLEQVLDEWSAIRAAIPDATLHVFYGFRDIYLKHAKRTTKAYDIKNRIESKIDQPGIVNHGMVGQHELHYWFAQCGFWLYPTSFEESYCITAAKAMAMGAIPVTSGYSKSSLPEVCGKYDLGLDPNPDKINKKPKMLRDWTNRVIELSGQDLSDHRSKMMSEVREKYTWSRIVDQWEDLFLDRTDRESAVHPQQQESPALQSVS